MKFSIIGQNSNLLIFVTVDCNNLVKYIFILFFLLCLKNELQVNTSFKLRIIISNYDHNSSSFLIVCQQLDNEFLALAERYKIKAGSTLLLSMVKDTSYTISNIGDSVGLLLKQSGEMKKLTSDQTPNREDEYKRIQESNGLITMKNGIARVDGSIAVSRAIGDI